MEKNNEYQNLVECFCGKVFYIKSLYYIQEELFEKGNSELLKQTAPNFFSDLNLLIVNNIILEMAKITDPSVDTKGNNNLSISNIIESIEWSPEVKDKLNNLNIFFIRFRKYINKARNKVIAHNDRNTYLKDISLGAFPLEDGAAFFDKIIEFCGTCHEAVCGNILGDVYLGQSGDVLDLKKTLQKAIAFDKYLDVASIEEAMIIEKIFMDIAD